MPNTPYTKGQRPGPHLAGGHLVINLDALAHNYRLIKEMAYPAEAAGVVKADAYGLGLEPVANTLWQEGCRRFFVALPQEGVALRSILPEAQIFVFNGLFGAEAAAVYGEARLIPVLNSPSDISIWEAYGWDSDVPRPCALHVETGINRLGLPAESARQFAEENALTNALTPLLIMTHLACADVPTHPMSMQQLESFQELKKLFSGVESSIANSAAVFLGGDFRCDLVRPGIALYGGNPVSGPVSGITSPLRPVVTALSRVAQVKHVPPGQCAGYGATPVHRDSIIAVCSTGYADGYHRAAFRPSDGQGRPSVMGFIHGHRVPVLGRVSMDLTLFDVTELGPDAVSVCDMVELFGANIPVDEVAAACGTISYELLTSLGQRYYREYVRSQA